MVTDPIDIYAMDTLIAVRPNFLSESHIAYGISVGWDLYSASPESIIINRSSSALIPTGIKVNLPDNVAGILSERGSITRTPFILRAGVIDPGYQGEVFVSLWNLSNEEDAIIHPGQKLPVQLCLYEALTSRLSLSREPENIIPSARGSQNIGSSDLP